jgi:gag-polypeptide of LTR copia-type
MESLKNLTLVYHEKLDLVRRNWPDWRDKIQTICDYKNLDGYIDGTSIRPTAIVTTAASTSSTPATPTVSNQAEIDAWDENDRTAKTILKININNFSATGINASTMSSAQLWEALANRFERKGAVGRMNAIDYLRACKYKDGTSIAQHWAELQTRRTNITHFGPPISDDEYCVVICDSVANAMKNTVDTFYTMTDPEALIDVITTIYQRRQGLAGKHVNPFGGSDNAYAPPATTAPNEGIAFVTTTGKRRTGRRTPCEWC